MSEITRHFGIVLLENGEPFNDEVVLYSDHQAAIAALQARYSDAIFALRLVRWFGSNGEIDGGICGKPELDGKSVSYFVEAAIAKEPTT